MAGYTMWLYAMGDYRALLTPLFATFMLLTALLAHYSQGLASLIPRLILLACTHAVIIDAMVHQPDIALLWLGLPIAATFLLLPLGGALLLTPLYTLLWWVLSTPPTLTHVLGYCALIALLALPPWEHARRRALLRATDPNDRDCNAYHIDTLKERLHNEYQRAAMLHKRLAVLVLHLPQLDMAEEQFGQRAQLALLSTLCNEVNSRCRDHDLLGRAGNATFWLVLPDTTESGALLVRERLHRALSRCVLVETGHLDIRISACLPCQNEHFDRYLQRLEARAQALMNA